MILVMGFPELSDSFLAGQDIFYRQFNDVYFYVEDTDQENLYFNILKRLFDDINFQKIFPLHGKGNLIRHAKSNPGDVGRIYIADSDFDSILGLKEDLDNVFYLDRYSIENYLVDKKGLFEVVREHDPKLKDYDIEAQFDYRKSLELCRLVMKELTCTFIVIQKYSLGIKYFHLNPARDVDFTSDPPTFKNSYVSDYFEEVERLLKSIDGRYTLMAKKKEFRKYINCLDGAVKNIPGKYLLNIFKYKLQGACLVGQMSNETLSYKLSKEFDVGKLSSLKSEILRFRGSCHM